MTGRGAVHPIQTEPGPRGCYVQEPFTLWMASCVAPVRSEKLREWSENQTGGLWARGNLGLQPFNWAVVMAGSPLRIIRNRRDSLTGGEVPQSLTIVVVEEYPKVKLVVVGESDAGTSPDRRIWRPLTRVRIVSDQSFPDNARIGHGWRRTQPKVHPVETLLKGTKRVEEKEQRGNGLLHYFPLSDNCEKGAKNEKIFTSHQTWISPASFDFQPLSHFSPFLSTTSHKSGKNYYDAFAVVK